MHRSSLTGWAALLLGASLSVAAAKDSDLVTVTPKQESDAVPAPASTDAADPGELARKQHLPITVHGEVGAAIDSRGGKAGYAAVDIAIGDNANVSLAYGASKGGGFSGPYGYGGYPYGYGGNGYGYGGYPAWIR